MSPVHLPRWLFATLLLAPVTGTALAAEFCATTALELSTALNDAAYNGEDDVIRVATGIYDGGGIHDFDYQPAYSANGDIGKDLIMIGGYAAFFGNPCGWIPVEDPMLTVLDGGDVERALFLNVRKNSNVTVRLLTFRNGDTGVGTNLVGGGLAFEGGGGGVLTIERNAFTGNQARYGAGLSIITNYDMVRVINNMFFANHAVECSAARIYSLNGTPGAVANIHVTNNTTTGNTVAINDATGGGGGFCVLTLGAQPSNIALYNNNVWGNDENDLHVLASDLFYLRNNNIGVRTGDAPTQSSGNISVAPQYESGLYNFTPVRHSSLVDAGVHPPPPPTLGFWHLTDYDLRFQQRVVGGTVDIGAYENENIFADGFD